MKRHCFSIFSIKSLPTVYISFQQCSQKSLPARIFKTKQLEINFWDNLALTRARNQVQVNYKASPYYVSHSCGPGQWKWRVLLNWGSLHISGSWWTFKKLKVHLQGIEFHFCSGYIYICKYVPSHTVWYCGDSSQSLKAIA